MLAADQLYDSIGLALTSSANFFINYVVFQVGACTNVEGLCDPTALKALLTCLLNGDPAMYRMLGM